MVDSDQRAFKPDFSGNNSAQLSFHNLVDSQHSMFHGTINGGLEYLECCTPLLRCLEFLRDRFKLVALDHIAHLIFTEIAELNSAFHTRTHFLYIILEAAQRRNPAVVNRLAFTKHAGTRCAGDPAISNKTAGHNASTQLKYLFDLGMANDRFSVFRLE